MIFANLIKGKVQAGLKVVPAPIRGAMKTKPALMSCAVLGAALTAYGTGQADGSEAIAGAIIGVGTVTAQSVPWSKVIPLVTPLLLKLPGLGRKK